MGVKVGHTKKVHLYKGDQVKELSLGNGFWKKKLLRLWREIQDLLKQNAKNKIFIPLQM